MNEKELKNFGMNLKKQRINAGLTQKTLAARLNVSRSCLANYESFQRCPDEEMILSVASCFGIDPKDLLETNADDEESAEGEQQPEEASENTPAIVLDFSHLRKKGIKILITL